MATQVRININPEISKKSRDSAWCVAGGSIPYATTSEDTNYHENVWRLVPMGDTTEEKFLSEVESMKYLLRDNQHITFEEKQVEEPFEEEMRRIIPPEWHNDFRMAVNAETTNEKFFKFLVQNREALDLFQRAIRSDKLGKLITAALQRKNR